LSSATQVVRRYVSSHYGELLNVDEARFNKATGTWEAELVSNYPRIIRDDKRPTEPFIKFIFLKNLGKVELDDKLNILSASTRAECSRIVEERFSLLSQRAERIMVQASADSLAGLTETRHVLAPVVKIVDNLLDRGAKTPEISLEDLAGEESRLSEYLDLLTETGIVKKVEGGYNSGADFINILAKYKDDYDSLVKMVLSHLIRTKYPALRTAFDIRQLEPSIHVDGTYYWPALEADRIIYSHMDTLRYRYIMNYGMISTVSFKSYLHRLNEADAIREEGGYFFANEKLFSEMQRLKGDMLENLSARV
jgi:hypothetical protein